MGEFATYQGQRIKVGTCEDMYYLRADQLPLISGYEFSFAVDRFRFPFPDEDGIEPGQFGDHNRGVEIPGWTLPPECEHDNCMETQMQLMQQAFRGGVLAIVVGCKLCGEKWWMPPEHARQVLIAFAAAGQHEIADRIDAGYQQKAAA